MIYPAKTEHLISNWDTDKIPVFKINCILILIIRFFNNNPVLLPDREKKKKKEKSDNFLIKTCNGTHIIISSASSMISSVFDYTPAYSLLKSFSFSFSFRVQSTFLFWGSFSGQTFFLSSISFYFKKYFLNREIFTFESNCTLTPKLYHLLHLHP